MRFCWLNVLAIFMTVSACDPGPTAPMSRQAPDPRGTPAVTSMPAPKGTAEEPQSSLSLAAEAEADVEPSSPTPWSGVVLRIEFIYPEKHRKGLGTGFVITDTSGNYYLITCAHLVDDGGWQARYRLRLHTLDGSRAIDDYGETLHIGRSVDLQHVMDNGRPDMTQDLVVRPVAGDWIQPLRLADRDPKIGDAVWVVGCEAKDPPHDERFYPGRIIETGQGGYVLKKLAAFDPRGFSGGPIVNAAGRVVGNVLAGGDSAISGCTVETIRRHLTEHGVIPQ